MASRAKISNSRENRFGEEKRFGNTELEVLIGNPAVAVQ